MSCGRACGGASVDVVAVVSGLSRGTTQTMEALLRREQAAGEASAAAQRGVAPPASSGGKKKKAEKKAAAAGALSREIADEYFIGGDDPDGSPDEADSDLEENGYAVPEAFKEPQTAAEADACVGHRVFLASTGAAGSIISWISKQKLFEVELDRGDERVTVRARDLMSLQIAPPASKKKTKSPAGKAKQKPSSSEGRGESSSMGIQKKKKKKPKA